jgi:putative salt-induced outer membrane protein YdiY
MRAQIRAVVLALALAAACSWTGVSLADETVIDEVMDNIERGELELGWSGAITATYFSRRGNSREEDWGLSLAWKYNVEGPWQFAGIEEEALGVLGYGRELFRRKNHRLIGEVGGGFLWSKDAAGESDSGGTGYGAAFYDWQMTEHSAFRQLIGVRYSEFDSNWKLTSKSEVKADIIGNLAGKFSYEIKRNSEVAEGTANSDFYTNFGLEYSF